MDLLTEIKKVVLGRPKKVIFSPKSYIVNPRMTSKDYERMAASQGQNDENAMNHLPNIPYTNRFIHDLGYF